MPDKPKIILDSTTLKTFTKRRMGETQKRRIAIIEILEPYIVEHTDWYVEWELPRSFIAGSNLPQDWGSLIEVLYEGGITTTSDDVKDTITLVAFYTNDLPF